MKKVTKKEKIETVEIIFEGCTKLVKEWIDTNQIGDDDPFQVCLKAFIGYMNSVTGIEHYIKISDIPFKDEPKIIIE